ncbi:MAG: hypothetical protein ACRCXB_25110 [Aeromonadaceae bacterium]
MITTFTALHDEMEKTLLEQIPALTTVQAYRDEPTDGIQTPAVLIGVDEMGAGNRVTGGRLAFDCTFSAYCLLSAQTIRAELEVINMAAAVGAAVAGSRWSDGGSVSRPEGITAVPGVFQSNGHGFECWIVSWRQTVHLGRNWCPPDLVNDALHPDKGSVVNPGVKPHAKPDPDQPDNLGGGIWLKNCHEHPHKLEDFPE